MWGPKELCGIFETKPALAGGLIEQGQIRNLGGGWKRRGLRCRGRGLGLVRASSGGGNRTVAIGERTGGSVNVRRWQATTGTGLRKRWGGELAAKASRAICPDVRWSTDLLRKRGRNGEWRLIVLHPLVARLQQLVDPILDDVVAALNAQCPNVGAEELTSFLLLSLGQRFNETSWEGGLTAGLFNFIKRPGAQRTLLLKPYAVAQRSTLDAERRSAVDSYRHTCERSGNDGSGIDDSP